MRKVFVPELPGVPDAVVALVGQCASCVNECARIEYVLAVCNELQLLCEERFLIYPFSEVPPVWHVLNVNVAIIAAHAAMLVQADGHELLARIRQLDLATIVSRNACKGEVAELIQQLQERVPCPARSPPRHRKKRRIQSFFGAPVNSALTVIPEIDAPSIPQFLEERCPQGDSFGAPFIVRGYASDWPALTPHAGRTAARWADIDYLLQRAGPGRIVPVETSTRYTDAQWGQVIMGWDEFLYAAGWDGGAARNSVYLAQHTLMDQFPWLAEDLRIPKYVYSAPPRPHYAPTAPHGSCTGSSPIASVWIGAGGTVSPAHTDPYYNCYVQVVGHKEVWLAPPDAQAYMDTHRRGCELHPVGSLMENTSRIDVFGDVPAYFRKHVSCRAQHAVLGPGDMLFFPPLWWHAMRALEQVSSQGNPGFSMSFWF